MRANVNVYVQVRGREYSSITFFFFFMQREPIKENLFAKRETDIMMWSRRKIASKLRRYREKFHGNLKADLRTYLSSKDKVFPLFTFTLHTKYCCGYLLLLLLLLFSSLYLYLSSLHFYFCFCWWRFVICVHLMLGYLAQLNWKDMYT